MRKLRPGQKVSVLANWKCLLKVTKQVSQVDYEIQLNMKVKKPFQINMLKECIEINYNDQAVSRNEVEVSSWICHEESEQYSCCGAVLDCEPDDKIETGIENYLIFPNETVNNDIKLDKQLDNQKEELKDILASYSDVVTDIPGRTNKIEHEVILMTEIPVTKKPHKFSYAMHDKVKEGIVCMPDAFSCTI